jgi:hypothetical protein
MALVIAPDQRTGQPESRGQSRDRDMTISTANRVFLF